MRRLIILLCGALLALMVVAPGVSARSSSGQSADLAKLAAGWWKWAVKKPSEVSPLLGDYSWKEQPQGAAKCAGGSRLGVFNLAGEFTLDENAGGGFVGAATRTCKLPAGKPIFFPVFNIICSPATNDTGDLQECATNLTDETLPASSYFATVDGESVPVERVASGPFTITLPNDNVLNANATPGSYPAATDGLWVYLPEGLPKGEHVITFGGTFPTPFGTLTLDITYNIIVK